MSLFPGGAQNIDITHIALPGYNVELPCDVDGQEESTVWQINGTSHLLNDLFAGAVAGHSLSGRNIVVEDIMMNDVRNGNQYRCVVLQTPPTPNIMGSLTALYVAGECKVCILLFIHGGKFL